MADVEENVEAPPPAAEEPVTGAASPVQEQSPATPPGEKEANKPPSPKPDHDDPDSGEVAPPLVSKEGETDASKPEEKAGATEAKGTSKRLCRSRNCKSYPT